MIDRIHILMADVGAAGDLLAVMEFAEAQSWAVAVEEGVEIIVELDEARQVLVMSSMIGRPDDSNLAKFSDLALRINYLWGGTTGIRIGLDGQEGEFHAYKDVSAALADAGTLAGLLRHFDGQVRALSQMAAAKVTSSHEALGLFGGEGIIRG